MKYSISFYHWLAGAITSVLVMVVTGIVLWGKSLFWEATLWQMMILPCVLLVSDPRVDESRSVFRTACLWLMLALVFIVSWRVPVDIFFIYIINH